ECECEQQPETCKHSAPRLGGCLHTKALRKLFVNSSEAAVGEDGDHVARTHLRRTGGNDSVHILQNPRVMPDLNELGCDDVYIQALVLGNGFGLEHVRNDNL